MKKIIFVILALILVQPTFAQQIPLDYAKRPFWLVAHMMNTPDQVQEALDDGANAIEVDITFDEDTGDPLKFYHGTPCDHGRDCLKKTEFGSMLESLMQIANREKNFTLLLLDLKLGEIENFDELGDGGNSKLYNSGKTTAQNIKDKLLGNNSFQLRVVFSIPDDTYADFHQGVKAVFGNDAYVGYDVGMQSYSDSGNSKAASDVTNYHRSKGFSNAWFGDGITNRFHTSGGCPNCDNIIQDGIDERDDDNGTIKKVWVWTVDTDHFIEKYLDMGVDAICTNDVEQVADHINSRKNYRMAKRSDNPFRAVKNVKYTIKFKTGTDSGAGTDSDIYLTMIGQHGAIEEFHVNSLLSGNAFENGDEDRLDFYAMDIGRVNSIHIRSKRNFAGADWKLVTVSISKNGKTTYFGYNNWVRSFVRLIGKDYYPYSNYTIEVKTGSKSGAGTDANVYIRLYGKHGTSSEYRLNGYLSGNAFENSDTDRLTLKNLDNLGPIHKIYIRHDNKYSGAGWYLNQVKVSGGGSSKTFKCNCWIESGNLSKTL